MSYEFIGWNNISVHAMNSAFALFEVLFTRVGPMPWLHVPFLVILLGCYLGVAYITHATQGFYSEHTNPIIFRDPTETALTAYSFLDPKKQGATLAAYIVGIAAAAVVIFAIVWGITTVRNRIWRKSEQEKYGLRGGSYDKEFMLKERHEEKPLQDGSPISPV